jgi:hypothetical protein
MTRDADALGPPVGETRDGAGSSVSSRGGGRLPHRLGPRAKRGEASWTRGLGWANDMVGKEIARPSRPEAREKRISLFSNFQSRF